MTKYLVDVYVPSVGVHYDTYLPSCKKMGEVLYLVSSMAESLSNGGYIKTADSALLNLSDGKPYDCNITVYDAGIRNSSKVILV